jgi:RNA polymerase sigma-70 factor (ECF subfamily)
MARPDDILYTYKVNFGKFHPTRQQMIFDDLFEQAKKLDPQALGSLHDQLYPVIYRYVSYRLQDDQLCEDITSEVFVRMIDTLHHKDHKIKDVRAWVLGVASNLINDHFRQKYRRKLENLEDHIDLPDHHSTEGSVDHSLTMVEIRWAMARLTPDQQHVLALRFSQEMSLEETASIIGKSVNAVKVLQFRALAAMRRQLEERWNNHK